MPGRLIVLEGLNGCGKSTTAAALQEVMQAAGKLVRVCRDPGDTQAGYNIRKLVKDPSISMRPTTQMLLYTAARSELAHQIEPYVLEGGHIILDRWWPSTYAYQGVAGGVDLDLIMKLVDVTTPPVCRTVPWLTFFLDPPIEECIERSGALRPGGGVENGRDRFEAQGLAFQQKLHEGYMRLVQLGHVRYVKYLLPDAEQMARFLYDTYIEAEIT